MNPDTNFKGVEVCVRATRYSRRLVVEGRLLKWSKLRPSRKQKRIIVELMKRVIDRYSSLKPRGGRGFIEPLLNNRDKEKLFKILNKHQREYLRNVATLEKL